VRSRTRTDGDGDRALRAAAPLFAAGFLLHNGDHLRRGLGVLTPQVFWAGAVGAAVALAAIALVLGRHRLAPGVAAAAGFPLAAGVAAVHLLPPWGLLCDSLPAGGAGALSWAAGLAEIGGARALGAAGAAWGFACIGLPGALSGDPRQA
jgi:hypothetical protein